VGPGKGKLGSRAVWPCGHIQPCVSVWVMCMCVCFCMCVCVVFVPSFPRLHPGPARPSRSRVQAPQLRRPSKRSSLFAARARARARAPMSGRGAPPENNSFDSASLLRSRNRKAPTPPRVPRARRPAHLFSGRRHYLFRTPPAPPTFDAPTADTMHLFCAEVESQPVTRTSLQAECQAGHRPLQPLTSPAGESIGQARPTGPSRMRQYTSRETAG
jgi:hypothetical protein